ncbi:hypothetical protein FQA39_LY05918 [Lamprigera yunnana]|nr:hypothetical protein FQA39_LY05918 [Lamprigera yunnana]
MQPRPPSETQNGDYRGFNFINDFFRHRYKITSSLPPQNASGPVIVIFLLGCTHIGITWLGANGTISDNAKYIIWFLIILATLIITEFAVGVWSMVLCGKIPETSAVLINSTFHDFVKYGYYKSDWESLQSEMECCAVNNMSDYIGIGSMPLSCCKSSDCSVEIFRIGCKDPVIAYVKKLLYNVGFISFGSAVFLFSLVLFVVLALELSISVIAFLNINQDVENNTKRLMVEQITSSNDTDKDNFHKIEQLFQCCGINNASDYVENVWPTIADFYCCGMLNCMEELQNNNESDIWFQPGCSNKVGKDIKQVVIETATVGTVCSVLQPLSRKFSERVSGFLAGMGDDDDDNPPLPDTHDAPEPLLEGQYRETSTSTRPHQSDSDYFQSKKHAHDPFYQLDVKKEEDDEEMPHEEGDTIVRTNAWTHPWDFSSIPDRSFFKFIDPVINPEDYLKTSPKEIDCYSVKIFISENLVA